MRGPTIKLAASFKDAVKELDHLRGVQAAVDQFIEALRAGGDSLPSRPVDGALSIHRADNPAEGADGAGAFAIQFVRVTREKVTTYTLIDIFETERDLYDPSTGD
jgi:hypothetical protein